MGCNLCRFAKKNIILAGLWCADEKPTMTKFFRPLVDVLNKLYTTGIYLILILQKGIIILILISSGMKVLTPLGQVTCRLALIACSCDLPARCTADKHSIMGIMGAICVKTQVLMNVLNLYIAGGHLIRIWFSGFITHL